MTQETKQCQNCKASFTIEPQDFTFYKKMSVPAPTFCPQCRLVRRLSHYNKRSLYWRICEHCQKKTLAMYDDQSPAKVYCNTCWWSDDWDPMKYGREYDFSRPFFEQVQELLLDVPWMALGRDEPSLVNSQYTNAAGYLKNCYLTFCADYTEDSYYCDNVLHCKDCIDSHMMRNCEECLESININNCSRVFYSVDCEESYDIWFSKNLVACSDCFGCVNLRKKKYCIFNKQYSKEEYHKKIESLDLSSYAAINKIKKKADAFFIMFPQKYMHGKSNVGVSGDYINNSKNTYVSFWTENTEDSKWLFLIFGRPTKDCFDNSVSGENSEQMYETLKSMYDSSSLKFCSGCWSNCSDLQYSTYCMRSSNLFACAGLRNKQYCILNKQYTKEEYKNLVPKIIQHMNDMPYKDKKGRMYKYGEFFPEEFSPIGYNQAIIQEFFPLTKKEADAKGYIWRDIKKEQKEKTLDYKDISDRIEDVKDDVLQETIGCQHEGTCNEQCSNIFRIIPQELAFYRKMQLPLPRLCPSCRHYQRIAYRNPLTFSRQSCGCNGKKSKNNAYENTADHFHASKPCPNKFDTAYEARESNIIYCESCYLSEVV